MSFTIDPHIQLNAFKNLVENITGNQYVAWISQAQANTRNNNRPWIEIEEIRSILDGYDEYIEDQGDKVRFRVVFRHRLLVYIHCKSRKNERFQAFSEAINLQALLVHSETGKVLSDLNIKIAEPDEETETLPALEFDSSNFDNRNEEDVWFPLTLLIVSEVNSPVLDSDWFEAVLLTTDIDGIDPSLNLDDERIPEEE